MEARADGLHGPKDISDAAGIEASSTQPLPSSSPTRSTQLPPNSNDPPRPGNSSADVPTPAPPVLTMFSYLNIRGLIPQTVPSKVPYVTDELISTSAAFFAMTETWLTLLVIEKLSLAGRLNVAEENSKKNIIFESFSFS